VAFQKIIAAFQRLIKAVFQFALIVCAIFNVIWVILYPVTSRVAVAYGYLAIVAVFSLVPLLIAALLGFDLGLPISLGIGTLMLLAMYLHWRYGSPLSPAAADRAGAIFSLLMIGIVVACILFGIGLLVTRPFDLDLPSWALIPVGFSPFVCMYFVSKFFKAREQARTKTNNRVDGVKVG